MRPEERPEEELEALDAAGEVPAGGQGEQPGDLEPLQPASRRHRGQTSRRVYSTGRGSLDKLVAEAMARLTSADEPGIPPANPDDLQLVREMLTTTLRLYLQHASRAELKMVNSALKEFTYSFRLFARYRDRRKVSIFGSARVQPGDPSYKATRDFAEAITRRGWMVITGAGPGIMAAGHEGAGAAQSFGANIRLPGINAANAYIAQDAKLINFKYFFTRKVTFLKESDAFVLLPGGWGTLDEAFELLTLMQTGKSTMHPVVMLEPEGSTYWRRWAEFIRDEILSRGFISPSDMSLLTVARTPEQAVAEIEAFYRNYVSARFVGERLILRLKQAPDADELRRLNREFADLLLHGDLQVVPPAPEEVRDEDTLDAQRLAFYPRHEYGRIRELIDELNRLPVPQAAANSP